MREDATSLTDILQVNLGALTVCKLTYKGGKCRAYAPGTHARKEEE
jgi:hypothetical protein